MDPAKGGGCLSDDCQDGLLVDEVVEAKVDDLDGRLGRIEGLVEEVLGQVRESATRMEEVEVVLFGDHRPGRAITGLAEQVRRNQPIIDTMAQLNKKLTWLLTTIFGGAATGMGALAVSLLSHQ